MKIPVLHNQSFLDIAIQHTGNVLNAFNLARANNRSIAESIPAGTLIDVPDATIKNTDILAYYQSQRIRPATEIQPDLIEIRPLSGIGYWEVETEFIIE